METYFIYYVEGFEKYDRMTDTYSEVTRIEVIADNEKDALARAKKMLKARNYCIRGCYERIKT